MSREWLLAAAVLLAVSARCHAQTSEESRLINIARTAIVTEVSHTSFSIAADDTPAKPVFVTIEVGGVIRGCRGSLVPRSRTMDEEVALAARGAAKHDPRYRPLSVQELETFLVTVTIVDDHQPIQNIESLQPGEGLILTSGDRSGIVLPWEGRDPSIRLKWAYKKAGVPEGAPVKLERLTARRFRG